MLILKVKEPPTLGELESLSLAQPKVFGVRKLTGTDQVIEVLLTLTEHSIPAIVVYLVTKLRENKHIEASFNGMKLKGISEQTVEKLLIEMLKKVKSND